MHREGKHWGFQNIKTILFLQGQDSSSHLFMFHLLTDSTDCDRFILSHRYLWMEGEFFFIMSPGMTQGFCDKE